MKNVKYDLQAVSFQQPTIMLNTHKSLQKQHWMTTVAAKTIKKPKQKNCEYKNRNENEITTHVNLKSKQVYYYYCYYFALNPQHSFLQQQSTSQQHPTIIKQQQQQLTHWKRERDKVNFFFFFILCGMRKLFIELWKIKYFSIIIFVLRFSSSSSSYCFLLHLCPFSLSFLSFSLHFIYFFFITEYQFIDPF